MYLVGNLKERVSSEPGCAIMNTRQDIPRRVTRTATRLSRQRRRAVYEEGQREEKSLDDRTAVEGKGRALTLTPILPASRLMYPSPTSDNLSNRSSPQRTIHADPTRPRTASARRDPLTKPRKIARGQILACTALYGDGRPAWGAYVR